MGARVLRPEGKGLLFLDSDPTGYWSDWVTDLAARGALGKAFQTAALTYVGSKLTGLTERLQAGLADLAWSGLEFRRLYGFDVAGVDDGLPVEVNVPWPVPRQPAESAEW